MPDLPQLTADELGWLATQDDVEARLIFTASDRGRTRYRVRHGPFDPEELEALPACDWTLLVQDVDKHLPDFRAWFGLCEFVPDWRLDDLMISVAAPGGSVGPHLDNYDVFLVQGTGTREWRCAAPGTVGPARDSRALALLHPFDDPDPFRASAGDVLYLPPGIPHWGIARDHCTTYSIGFRAPTRAELLAVLRRQRAACGAGPRKRDQTIFYSDPDLRVDEALPGHIAPRAIERCRELLGAGVTCSNADIARALGVLATATKAWLAPETMDDEPASRLAATVLAGAEGRVHGMARLAWVCIDRGIRFFVNGRSRQFAGIHGDLATALCRHRRLDSTVLRPGTAGPGDLLPFLTWLARCGAIEPAGADSPLDA